MLSIKFIINPVAGKIQSDTIDIKSLLKKMSDNNILAEIIFTKKYGIDKEMLFSNIENKDAIVICGGDGTLNNVITYMINYSIRKPILFIPGGTVNVFHFEKKLSSNADKIIKNLITWNVISTDIGYVKHNGGINYFLLMLGVGFDSNSVHEADLTLKKLLGKATYLFSGIKNIITYKPKQLILKLENGKIIENVHSVIISNGRFYGGNMEFFPNANMHDGILDMYIFNAGNNMMLLKNVIDVQFGNINAKIKYKQIRSIEIFSKINKDMPFQVDGECVGKLPIKVGILPKKMDFILPL
ncbi:MAG: YegS/Rv2252/BmrU family lipid kinase [Elusimicrobiota bacterium]|jgi:YegS/Rv2252/BmrU family lipid kinase|nr:YegS/Rv2252/BmrU family lipid kinase [Elusimicrobiota bacterium]